jgi:protein SCO1/2
MQMKAGFLLIGLLLGLVAGCGLKSAAPSTTTLPAQSPGVTNYDARGIIQQVAPDRRTATIKHDKISGYMAAMTMDFPVKDTNELAGLGPDDEITFKLAVTDTNDWIQNIHFVAHHIREVTNDVFTFHEVTAELKPGDVLPDEEMTGEDGRTFRFSDFHGSAVAFTFFYTSCPLPDYCPRMNRNLAEARKLILAQTNAPANWELLSISFDPDFDKPELLSGYGNFYRGDDPNRWRFAAASTNALASLAPELDLHFWHEAGTISHNLRTVVLDTQGKIACQLDGNDWTPEQLAAAIIKAARVK